MSRVSVFTLLSKSDKNMGAVNSRVRDYTLELVKRSYHEGINVLITSGYRSYSEQTKLYNQGRTTKGSIVTNAKAGYSIHNFGYAIDYVVCNDKGVPVWTVTNDWKRVGEIGKAMGFQWGGDWISFKDYPHLDFQKKLSLADFRNGKRPTIPSLPSRGYIGIGDDGTEVLEFQKLANKKGANLEEDGVFGEGSEKWLKTFQLENKLIRDGLYGIATRLILEIIIPKKDVKTEVKPVAKVKSKERLQYDKTYQDMIDLGITDGSKPHEAPTREQVAVMIGRALKISK